MKYHLVNDRYKRADNFLVQARQGHPILYPTDPQAAERFQAVHPYLGTVFKLVLMEIL